MAQLKIKYSEGVEPHIAALCAAGLEAMTDVGVFPVTGRPVGAFLADQTIVAGGLVENAFGAMALSVGAGRSPRALTAAGDAAFAAAQTPLAGLLLTEYFARSLEIRENRPEPTWLDTPIHARLSGKT